MNISLTIPEDADGLGLTGTVHPTVDANPKPSRVDFYLNGVIVQATPALVWTWDTTKYTNGTYKLAAYAYYKTRKSAVGPLVVTVANGVTPPPLPTNTSPPTISGTPQSGQTLTASPGTWSPAAPSLTYAWHRVDPATGNAPNVGTNSPTYVITDADVGFQIVVQVAPNDVNGAPLWGQSVDSALTAVVTKLGFTASIQGSPVQGAVMNVVVS